MESESKSTTGWVWGVVIVLVAAVLGVAVYAMMNTDNKNDSTTKTETTDTSDTNNSADVNESRVGSTVITFTDDGFDKSEYTSKAGEAVTVKNNSSMELQFSSDDHPTHLENPELNIETLAPGESGTFTPPGTGSYDFHDHVNDQFTGTLIVE